MWRSPKRLQPTDVTGALCSKMPGCSALAVTWSSVGNALIQLLGNYNRTTFQFQILLPIYSYAGYVKMKLASLGPVLTVLSLSFWENLYRTSKFSHISWSDFSPSERYFFVLLLSDTILLQYNIITIQFKKHGWFSSCNKFENMKCFVVFWNLRVHRKGCSLLFAFFKYRDTWPSVLIPARLYCGLIPPVELRTIPGSLDFVLWFITWGKTRKEKRKGRKKLQKTLSVTLGKKKIYKKIIYKK